MATRTWPKWTRLCDFLLPEVVGDVFPGNNARTVEGYTVLPLEIGSFISFRDIRKNNFVTAAEAAADIDDSIRRKYIRATLKLLAKTQQK